MHLTPATEDPDVAADWFSRFEGAGLDGVVAKAADLHYLPDKRAMLKVKHQRTADCVVAGFRTHKDGAGVGSLLLGLYDASGRSTTSAWPRASAWPAGASWWTSSSPTGRTPRQDHPWAGWAEARRRAGRRAAMNRWNAGKDMSWEPLRPEAVCEVAYDHLQENRFRHATSFVRWRPDRDAGVVHLRPARHPGPLELAKVFGTGKGRAGAPGGVDGPRR